MFALLFSTSFVYVHSLHSDYELFIETNIDYDEAAFVNLSPFFVSFLNQQVSEAAEIRKHTTPLI